MSRTIAPIQQIRLRRFVDRESEVAAFQAMLDQDSAERPVTVIWGESGMGKSSLLDRLEVECHERAIRLAKVAWTETRNHDYLGVMRKIRDDVGAERFAAFSDRANFFTVPQYKVNIEVGGTVSAGDGMVVHGTVGNVSGVVVQDLNLHVPRADLGISETERMGQLTDVFLADLHAAEGTNRTVIFLDAFEKASPTTRAWVAADLVGALINGRLGKMRLVICGCVRPRFDDESWWEMVREMQLSPLTRDHVLDYMRKVQLPIPQEVAGYVADTLLATTGGVPASLANAVNLVAKQWQPKAA